MSDRWSFPATIAEDDVDVEFRILRTWKAFTDIFADAKRVKTVTYCDSPQLVLRILDHDEVDIDSLEVVVGDRNAEQYRQKLTNHVDEAYRMKELIEDGRLSIYTLDSSRSILHTKLYRIVNHDGSHTLVIGSANLSKQAWGNTKQTNTVAVFHTDGTTDVDEAFAEMYDVQKEDYTAEFMADLIDELEALDTSEEEKERVSAWVDGRVGDHDEVTELNKKATEELDNVEMEVHALTDDPETADSTVAFVDDPDEADEVLEERISLSTTGFDDGTGAFEGLKSYDNTTIKDNVIRTTTRAYTQYLQEEYGIPKMWFSEDDGTLLLDGPSRRHSLMADELPDDPARIDRALADLEAYFETVEKHGDSNDYEAVKAHMFEALIWFFWAPFANKYASRFREASLTLDDALPFLYIYGESNAGKGTFTEFALSLISHSVVSEPADADEVGVPQVRGLKKVDSAFPLVVDDVTKQQIDQQLDGPLRNYWKNWPGDVQYPALAFISNNKRPNKWFRNRAKILHFDVFFEGTFKSRHEVGDVIDQQNPLYEWFTHLLGSRDIELRESNDTLYDARQVFLELYDRAGREVPEYFPRRPADEHYDTAKGKWHRAHDRGQLEFNEYDGNLIAVFNEDMKYDVKAYGRSLPTRMRADVHGLEIEIKHVENFAEWFGDDPVGVIPDHESPDIETPDASDAGIVSRIRGSLFG
ncbi:phospholipase D-like domain-containing protein [Natrarchaeobaculum sulfurireducens]|uniref:Tyrosyl-DNA phosphodiesterase n=1 Tax=Natrarchaeobaculum sulfurireducens TaxID=2044521 RepID=A0A346PK64_9EURY|nr:phospholipase D-like domain-containing protein [Natrarchaeobaculum sulfurireducens]AXR79909.1 Tyrosyl-DNA phosphodiesterase [Natrarchaeobaculum sulfurireducens]